MNNKQAYTIVETQHRCEQHNGGSVSDNDKKIARQIFDSALKQSPITMAIAIQQYSARPNHQLPNEETY